ncbi:PREDICTED: uncharacterized protein LOC104779013 [Camelina sativa]|uniref:Uncharacterized protein LOC104779013 n=1 Tax=Camelina sativa TaxID=90675 RepID=A0ABM0YJ30_CAMSA|nr:PREDICTED: uncharacterized protein LOC104779013 [Camelina sativa]
MAIGDFNEIKGNHEKRRGPPRPEISFADFQNMIQVCDFHDMKHHGDPFTWTGKRHSHDVACRLDRTMDNNEWLDQYPTSHVEFLELIESDHRPVITTISNDVNPRQGQFYYDNRLSNRDGFIVAINRGWNRRTLGNITNLSTRLKECRKAISHWKRSNPSNSREEINFLKLIDKAHSDRSSRQQIQCLRHKLSCTYANEEEFWRVKSRKEWISFVDRNTKYFFATAKSHTARNKLYSILDDEGNEHRGDSHIG